MSAGAQDGAVHQWVDKDGQIHITTTPPPKGAAAVKARAAEERWVYEWLAPDGSAHVTTSPPPGGAKLRERVEDPRAKPSEPAGAAAQPVSSLRAPGFVGRRAPDLEYSNAMGEDVSLADLRGDVVWLVFASRHSDASVAQAKVFGALADAYGDDFSVYFVVGASADLKAARAFAEQHSLPPELVLAATPDAFPMGAVPHHVFLDRSGRVAKVHPGRLGAAEVRAALDALR